MTPDEAVEISELASLVARLETKLAEMTARALPLAAENTSHDSYARANYLRRPKPPLPDPRLIRRIIRQRRLRARYFEGELFADPAWDILLDLTAARAEHRRVCVTSLCAAAGVPHTTALRWIAHMTEMRILVRTPDPTDRRRVYIALADPVADTMARYFEELGQEAGRMV
jgi:DNA-binding MarR family transcriptional regulator